MDTLLPGIVESMLSTRTGDDHYPGTSRTVAIWPGVAPGDRGVRNAARWREVEVTSAPSARHTGQHEPGT